MARITFFPALISFRKVSYGPNFLADGLIKDYVKIFFLFFNYQMNGLDHGFKVFIINRVLFF